MYHQMELVFHAGVCPVTFLLLVGIEQEGRIFTFQFADGAVTHEYQVFGESDAHGGDGLEFRQRMDFPGSFGGGVEQHLQLIGGVIQ